MDKDTVANFFNELASQIKTFKHAQRTDMNADTVGNFFNELAFKMKISKGFQCQLDRYLATGMNIVRDYVAPDENRLSDILRDLLNPDGPHGQGSVFLDNFLMQIGLPEMSVDAESESIREHCISGGRRIDVLLKFANKMAIGIENKPFAGDQQNQVKDYCEYLQKTFRGGYRFFYLTPNGVDPPTYSIDEERRTLLTNAGILRCISFQVEIKGWLEACFRECKAERVRWFLRDLIDFIGERFVN
jgi:hypothetical protein